MIEVKILHELQRALGVKVFMEMPENEELDDSKDGNGKRTEFFVVFEKTSSKLTNHLNTATFAFQSYAPSLYKAMELNHQLKKAVLNLLEYDDFAFIKLNSDYNFTDTQSKYYRYQAVFDMKYYEED